MLGHQYILSKESCRRVCSSVLLVVGGTAGYRLFVYKYSISTALDSKYSILYQGVPAPQPIISGCIRIISIQLLVLGTNLWPVQPYFERKSISLKTVSYNNAVVSIVSATGSSIARTGFNFQYQASIDNPMYQYHCGIGSID